MKIKCKMDLEIGDKFYKAGDVLEIPEEQGRPMVCAGYVVMAKADAAPAPEAPAPEALQQEPEEPEQEFKPAGKKGKKK